MDPSAHLLLVEDEPDMASFIQQGLQEEGYHLHWVSTGQRALDLLPQTTIDLVLLDVRLPDLSGLEVCHRIRLHRPNIPVLMLTALDGVDDKVKGLRAGADDYVPKPFAFDELLARIEALLRRAYRTPIDDTIQAGPLHIDPGARTCTVHQTEVDLTPTEFDLLAYLVARPNTALSRDTIHRDVWGHDFDRGTNLIDVYINYLRRKLADAGCDDSIRTVRGVGYRYVGCTPSDST